MTQLITRYSRDQVSNKVAAARKALAAKQRKSRRNTSVEPGTFVFNPPFRESEFDNAASAGSSVGSAVTKKELHYTGNKVLGISLMHKSNLVPVFSQTDAEEIAHMRR